LHKVIVEKQCGCFKKSRQAAEVHFNNHAQARAHADEKKNKMNKEWCRKHNFYVEEQENHFIIKAKN
jgi:hypothetical protein